MTLLVGWIGCAGNGHVIPEIGPAFGDWERDPIGSDRRADEFEAVCVAPATRIPPEVTIAPNWCAWTMQADQVIRANNAKARR